MGKELCLTLVVQTMYVVRFSAQELLRIFSFFSQAHGLQSQRTSASTNLARMAQPARIVRKSGKYKGDGARPGAQCRKPCVSPRRGYLGPRSLLVIHMALNFQRVYVVRYISRFLVTEKGVLLWGPAIAQPYCSHVPCSHTQVDTPVVRQRPSGAI